MRIIPRSLDRRVTHGKCPRGKQPKKYTAWRNIKSRTRDQKHPAFKDYGGRGITMCDAWFDSFAAFDRAVSEPPTNERCWTLDRIDNEQGYVPGNVQWATRRQQANNKRNTCMLTYQERTQSLPDWCLELGLVRITVYKRLFEYGMSIEEALTRPKHLKRNGSKITI